MNPTPEQLQELWEWYQARKVQQLSLPVDDASRNALGAAVGVGPGSTATSQSVNISTTPMSISVPAAYAGTEILVINGVQREIPYIA